MQFMKRAGSPGAALAGLLILLSGMVTSSAEPANYQAQLISRCDSGEGLACAILGSRLQSGNDGEVDMAVARTAYKRACEIGHLSACPNIARFQRQGYGGPKDAAAARQSLILGCNGNDDDSCRTLGNMYKDGFGGPQNYALAAEAYDKACKAGKTWICDKFEEMRSKAAAQAPKTLPAPQPAPAQDYYASLYEISIAGHIANCELGVKNKIFERKMLESCQVGSKAAHEQYIEFLGRDDSFDSKRTGVQALATARAYLTFAEYLKFMYDRNKNPDSVNFACVNKPVGVDKLWPDPNAPVPPSLETEHARLKGRFEQLDQWCDSFE
ncbi:MAG: hypothetical protein CMK09_18890 [Ponticaulis sp.]|nr:hypothetical protein [Ponticaulis sp.]|tara:strand:+ start:150595 stop:151572 length:978 start_codon:yes stop_codon:yes gene_type:complete